MIRHIVMYKFIERTTDIVAKTKEILYSMVGKVPQILDLECGEDYLGSARSFDFFLSILFESKSDLESYQKDPYHVEVVKKHMHSVMKESCSVDCQLDKLSK